MRNLLRKLSDHLYHNRTVHTLHRQMISVRDSYDNAPDPASKAVFCGQMAHSLNGQADSLAASWLARATTALPGPAQLRAEAAQWQINADLLWILAAKENTNHAA